MSDTCLDQLPRLKSIAGDVLVPWQRLWCPFGGQISMEGYGFEEGRRGFLAEPSPHRNAHCRKLTEWIVGDGGWVLCGAPGTGKSGEIRQFIESIRKAEPNTTVLAWQASSFISSADFDLITSHRLWKDAKQEGRKIVVVVDGFDQRRIDGGLPFEALAARLSGYGDLSSIRFLIGCRAADWDPARGQAFLDLWPKSDVPKVLEICPLRRAEIVVACEARGLSSANSFILEVFAKRLEAVAHWPLTLRSLLEEFQVTNRLPEAVGELISRTIDILLSESGRSVVRQLDQHELRQLARRGAAISILSAFQAVSMDEWTSGVLTPTSFVGPPSLARERLREGGTCQVSKRGFEELIETGLFTPVRPPTELDSSPPLGFVHQSYAEFLSAEYLSGLNVRQLRSLLLVAGIGGESVPGPLIEVASWLASMHQEWFSCLTQRTPEILLRSDGSQFTDAQKKTLMNCLLERVKDHDAGVFLEIRKLTPAFVYPGLSDALRSVILDRDAASLVRRFAINVAEQCCLTSLEEDLWQVLERNNDDDPREWIVGALYDLLHASPATSIRIERLWKLVREEMGPDLDDELKGLGLILLVPSVASPREVVPWLNLRKNESLFGAYHSFVEYILPAAVSLDDLEAFFVYAGQRPSILHCEHYGQKLGASLLMHFSKIESPNLRLISLFNEWVMRCVERYAVLPIEGDKDSDHPAFPDEVRLRWLQLVIGNSDFKPEQSHILLRALGILRPPLDWALLKLANADESKRSLWAEVCRPAVYVQAWREEHLALLLDTYSKFWELRAALRPCHDGLNIHESYLAFVEEYKQKEAQYSRQSNGPKKHPTRREWIDRWFDAWANGHRRAWVYLWKAFASDEDGSNVVWSGDFVTEWAGWGVLSDKEKKTARDCARAFLLEQDDAYRASPDWKGTNWSEAATFAVGLLADELSTDHKLAQVIATSWMVAWTREITSFGEANKGVAAALFPLNPEDCLNVLREKFYAENAGNSYCGAIRLLDYCWSEKLSHQLANWLCEDVVRNETFRTGFEFLSSKSSEWACFVANFWLNRIAQNPASVEGELAATVRFCALLLTHGALFDEVFAMLDSDQMAEQVLMQGALTFGYGGREPAKSLMCLNVVQLGKIYVLMARLFPVPDEIRAFGSHNVTGLDMMQDAVKMVEARFASIASLEEIAGIRKQLSASRQRSLSFARSHCIRNSAASEWKPIEIQSLLRVVQRPHACFIRTQDDLVEFVIERLKAFPQQPWDVCIQPLWNEPTTGKPSPKHEDALSNALKRWLDSSFELVVNREVQPVEIMPHRLDLKIDMPGDPPLNTVIEVKKAENVEVETSMQSQLVNDYLIRGGRSHGIYLVAWFGGKASQLGGLSPEEDSIRLQQLCSRLVLPPETRVESLLIDCRYKSHSPPSARSTRSRRKRPKTKE